jgi:predicted enzyme related to lactoylglutathione lyase
MGQRRWLHVLERAPDPRYRVGADFYGALFGWEIEPIEQDGKLLYTTIKNAGNQNGGFMPVS